MIPTIRKSPRKEMPDTIAIYTGLEVDSFSHKLVKTPANHGPRSIPGGYTNGPGAMESKWGKKEKATRTQKVRAYNGRDLKILI
jgi:hypothetical protein